LTQCVLVGLCLVHAAKDGAAAVKRGTGKAVPKAHGSLWAAESTAAMKAIGAYSSRRKPDGWGFSKAPTHAGMPHATCLALCARITL
jgi:hypothetical protein